MNWTISFALQPDLQFKFFLARELRMTVRQLVETMDCVEYHWWACHFQRKAEAEKAALEKSRSKMRRQS